MPGAAAGIGAIVAPLVSTAIDAYNENANREQSKSNQDRQNAANRALAEYQYSKDLEMWNRGNRYNSPEEQMSRLKAAGLNPNMVYGSGSATGNTATNLPKYQAPQMEFNQLPMQLPDAISRFQDFALKNAQIDNLQEQREQRAIDNDFKGGSVNADGQRRWGVNRWKWDQESQKAAKARFQQQWGTGADGRGGYVQTFSTQLEAMKNANRNKILGNKKMLLEMDKLKQDTAYKRAQTDWYTTNVIGGLAGKLMAPVTNMLKGSRRSGGAGRAKPIGTAAPQRNNVGRISNEWLRKNGYK